jgi:hypothetical protein
MFTENLAKRKLKHFLFSNILTVDYKHVRRFMSLAYLNFFRDVSICFLTKEAFHFITAKKGIAGSVSLIGYGLSFL